MVMHLAIASMTMLWLLSSPHTLVLQFTFTSRISLVSLAD